jgi:hypothetical protein
MRLKWTIVGRLNPGKPSDLVALKEPTLPRARPYGVQPFAVPRVTELRKARYGLRALCTISNCAQ